MGICANLSAAAFSAFPFIPIHPTALPSWQAVERHRATEVDVRCSCFHQASIWVLTHLRMEKFERVLSAVVSSLSLRGVDRTMRVESKKASFFVQPASAEPQVDQGCFFLIAKVHKYS
ncbi:hypothetical protein QR685DRAFT_317323 [Neurospora intermedia]|uniref:Uncharacterized protein n=1 Tax=Neurospora intermedia TaxID=5142 RepID=A0ABR3D828_NEUIN